ncbi:MAG: BREX-1 system adenine-specific DNA-methyltransferase PglX [Anaerolineales bacterium]|nr:BREX-1 system adenine-specific DNA-methyltransferase PglX [Anaerolineales bacterium]
MYTYDKDEARQKIAALVEAFHTNEMALEKAPEAQIENDFIRPLFEALNWNVRNEGLSPTQQEFRLQRTDRLGKRPDYILHLDGRNVLVMDAKQVKYSMHDPRWLNQVYSYAYSSQNSSPSKKIDFAILTDFQEFIVLDCTLFAARHDAVNNFRAIDWTYNDYVTQFDTLWELFERNNVLNDSKERKSGLWSRYLSPQKVKANRIAPDKAFLAQMDDEKTGWRVLLAKDMKKHNPSADGELITAAVQLWIDRLIFVKALSDREVDEDYLSQLEERVARAGLGEDDTSWFKACRDIFESLNNFYNGSIFKSRPELEAVSVSNKVVRSIIRDLQPENSPYNFAVLPVEILGTIYERFLGRVVRTTDKQVKIEDKPEVRKAGGVYYTPQYIVDYIVKNTLGKLLAECKTPADAARLKILDPACGSGSFLLGAYSALIEWHKDYYSRAGKEKRDQESFYIDENGEIRLTAKLKREILRNNLYGVDIDPQAVEVTVFSLSLKALEDLREGELTEERTLFHQTVLPDLSANIKNGNSLIGSDYFSGQMFPDAATMKRVNAFDWEKEFPQIFGAQPIKVSPSGTMSETFRDSGMAGFDAIIGNPPYIRIQNMKEWAPLEVEIYKELYTSAKAGNYDIYVVFVEKALSLLNQRGRLGYILPHKFFNAQYGAGLRGEIARGRHLGKVIHFGDLQVFDGATTYTCLLFLDKTGNDEFDFVKVKDLEGWRAQTSEVFETSEVSGRIAAANVTEAEWNFTVGQGARLFERLSQMPVKLGDISKIFVGLQTSADTVFLFKDSILPSVETMTVSSKELSNDVTIETALLKPVVRSGDIVRYFATPTALVLFPYEVQSGKFNLIAEKKLRSDFKKTWDYLTVNKKLLSEREHGKFMNIGWYQLYPKNLDTWEQPKIMMPYMITRLSAYYDEEKFYFVNVTTGGFGLTTKPEYGSQKYITGLLNSKLLDWYMKQVSTTFHGGYYAANKQFLVQLPIRAINFSDPAEKAAHDKMVSLVEQMLALHKDKAAAKTQSVQEVAARQIRAVDEAIDRLVYELYGLSEEEIKSVEGK